MEHSDIRDNLDLETGDSLFLDRLYWTSSDGEDSISDSSESGSVCESLTTTASKQEACCSPKSDQKQKAEEITVVSLEEEAEQEKLVFEGWGLRSPEMPHPITTSERVIRFIPNSPGFSRTPKLLSHPWTEPIPQQPFAYRRVSVRRTFDRVLDLSVIKDRKQDYPKIDFAENGDVLSPIPTTDSSAWKSKSPTPKKASSPASNGDFMSKSGGLGLTSASWIL